MNKHILFFGLALAFTGCSTTNKAWQDADQSGTIEAYEKYLETHPHTPEASEAERRIKEIKELKRAQMEEDWSKARSANTITAYREFLARHGLSDWRSIDGYSAKDRLEILESEADWRVTKSTNTISAYEEFIDKHPDSYERSEAEQALNRLRAEGVWEGVKTANSIPSYEAFLKDYPWSQYDAEARKRLSVLLADKEWTRVESTGSESVLIDFILKYPYSTKIEIVIPKLKSHQVVQLGGVIPWSTLGGKVWSQAFGEGLNRSRGIFKYGENWGGLEDGVQQLQVKNMVATCLDQLIFNCTEKSEIKSFNPANLQDVRFNGHLVATSEGFRVQEGIAVVPSNGEK